MVPNLAKLLEEGGRAYQAASGQRFWLCRPCDHRWMSENPTCMFCDEEAEPVSPQNTLHDPVNPHGPRIPETRYFEGLK